MGRVTLKDVGKYYDSGVKAVSGVNLAIQAGEIVVLVGPSGCGKSTTLRMVAGLEDISAGTIEIDGRVVNNLAPKERDIAMVFQNYALYPHMTCFDNMAFALKLRGEKPGDVKKRVEETAAVLGIEKLLDRKPKQLSGGQRQRVAVGRAMVRKPAIYLFDEPLSNLDARLRVEMRAELKRLHAELRTTTLYVTHDQEEAMTLGDRIVVMSEGKVQQCGAPLDIFERPQNRFVAGFLGTPPMNFLPGTLHEGGVFEGSGLRVELLPSHHAELAGHEGAPVVLGVRPEHVSLSGEGTESAHGSARIDVTEPLGSAVDVYLTTRSGQRLVARVPAHLAKNPGGSANLTLAVEHCHLFAPGPYGENLLLGARQKAA
jgi:multiple sugar transport system ATP-binding protein